MSETTKTYEQYCTHIGKNVVMKETIDRDGNTEIVCTNSACEHNGEGCKNKLRKN